MMPLQLFTKLGLFIKEDFLTAQFCGQFLEEARSTARQQSQIWRTIAEKSVGTLVDEKSRKTQELQVSEQTREFIKQRLRDIKPELEQYFQVSLAKIELPKFYLYEPGDFFELHRDRNEAIDAPEVIQKRQVSVVIFLNRQSEMPCSGDYSGGALTFYGLIPTEQWQSYGFPFAGAPGTLVAFRSDVWHEVKPVLDGERYTIVSWFL